MEQKQIRAKAKSLSGASDTFAVMTAGATGGVRFAHHPRVAASAPTSCEMSKTVVECLRDGRIRTP